METKNAVRALAALAHKSRLSIFRLLVEKGETGLPVGKIGATLRIAPATLSFHLKELAHTHLLTPQQDGRSIIYRANFTTVTDLISFLTDNCCDGRPAICVPRPKKRRTPLRSKP